MAYPLSEVSQGEKVVLVSLLGGQMFKSRLTDMGLNEGVMVKVMQTQRVGPCVVLVGNSRLLLGHGMAQKILVEKAG